MHSRPLKFDQFSGDYSPVTFGIAASEVFKNLSGHFVRVDGNGYISVPNATHVNIVGWAYTGEITSSSTAGGTKATVNVNLEAVYEIPAILNDGTAPTEAQLLAVVGETCDIKVVDTYYQYANINTSSIDILHIVGYRYYGAAVGMQSVLVKINVDKAVQTSA